MASSKWGQFMKLSLYLEVGRVPLFFGSELQLAMAKIMARRLHILVISYVIILLPQ